MDCTCKSIRRWCFTCAILSLQYQGCAPKAAEQGCKEGERVKGKPKCPHTHVTNLQNRLGVCTIPWPDCHTIRLEAKVKSLTKAQAPQLEPFAHLLMSFPHVRLGVLTGADLAHLNGRREALE